MSHGSWIWLRVWSWRQFWNEQVQQAGLTEAASIALPSPGTSSIASSDPNSWEYSKAIGLKKTLGRCQDGLVVLGGILRLQNLHQGIKMLCLLFGQQELEDLLCGIGGFEGQGMVVYASSLPQEVGPSYDSQQRWRGACMRDKSCTDLESTVNKEAWNGGMEMEKLGSRGNKGRGIHWEWLGSDRSTEHKGPSRMPQSFSDITYYPYATVHILQHSGIMSKHKSQQGVERSQVGDENSSGLCSNSVGWMLTALSNFWLVTTTTYWRGHEVMLQHLTVNDKAELKHFPKTPKI
ncbi:hypothetical protein BU15DRAFT_68027 [Melanogaster broomeanus]|nr:hypothetical protein BU15DRAFT_68027 [Melanogaster broomeanus]